MAEDYDEELARQWYDRKTQMMVAQLGNEHDRVMHAMLPFAISASAYENVKEYGPGGVAAASHSVKRLVFSGLRRTHFFRRAPRGAS